MSKRYVITGGPGAGKSTLIEALRDDGWTVFKESGRRVIQDRKSRGLPARPELDEFGRAMLEIDEAQYAQHGSANEVAVYDRGVVDTLSYLWIVGGIDRDELVRRQERYRYAMPVFIAPLWPEIYCQDGERDYGYREAVAVHDRLCDCYTDLGYELIELPKVDVPTRLEFVKRVVEGDAK